jgi:hypothetical protein
MSPRRSAAASALLKRARTVHAAIGRPATLAAIAKADKNAKKVRIDRPWVDQFAQVIDAAEHTLAGRAVRITQLKTATKRERETATELAAALTRVRDTIATHHPDNALLQQAFGRGARIDARVTSALIGTAGAVAAAYAAEEWHQAAVDAGITQPTMDALAQLAERLSSADLGQHGVITSGADGTLDRGALLKVLQSLSAHAIAVARSVFGRGAKELAAFADPRPRVGARAKPATVAPSPPRAPASTAARKARRNAVNERAAELARGPVRTASAPAGPRGAVAKPAKPAKPAKRKRGKG